MDNSETIPVDSNKSSRFRHIAVPIGFILIVIAWFIMMLEPYTSFGCVILGLIFSIIGVRIAPGPRRNFAITAIVAGSVLLLVFIIISSIFLLI